MKATIRKALLLIGPFAIVFIPACGESILTAGAKVAQGQISQLSANEIKILNQAAIDLLAQQDPPVTVPVLNDAQAQALSDFFGVNQLDTVTEIQQLAKSSQSDINQLQGVDALAAAFAGSNTTIDPNNVDPNTIDQIIGTLFGG